MQKAADTASYVGGGVSVVAALTLTDIGIIVGIVTALLTFIANMIYQWRRDRREQLAFQLRIKKLSEDINEPL